MCFLVFFSVLSSGGRLEREDVHKIAAADKQGEVTFDMIEVSHTRPA